MRIAVQASWLNCIFTIVEDPDADTGRTFIYRLQSSFFLQVLQINMYLIRRIFFVCVGNLSATGINKTLVPRQYGLLTM